MVDRANFSSIVQATKFIKFYTSRTSTPIVIIANKSDHAEATELESIKSFYGKIIDCPIVECSAIDKDSAKKALLTVLFEVVSKGAVLEKQLV